MIRLRIPNSKNKEGRILPMIGRLLELIQERKADRRLDCLYVFHRNGRQIVNFTKSWRSACDRAGLGGFERQANGRLRYNTVPHDFRRSTARNLDRSGVSQSIAMKITGHKTPSMYRRYNIVDERDLKAASERMQNYLTQHQTPKVVPIAVNEGK